MLVKNIVESPKPVFGKKPLGKLMLASITRKINSSLSNNFLDFEESLKFHFTIVFSSIAIHNEGEIQVAS